MLETEFEKFLQRTNNELRLELIADVPQPFYQQLQEAIQRFSEDRLEDVTND